MFYGIEIQAADGHSSYTAQALKALARATAKSEGAALIAYTVRVREGANHPSLLVTFGRRTTAAGRQGWEHTVSVAL